MKARFLVHLELGADALEALRRPVNGSGGFQSLLRQLQNQIGPGEVLVLTPDSVERIARYVARYGQGGFQGRLDTVLAELANLAKALEPMAA